MPLYICSSAAGAIEASEKARIAADITRIHCEVTDAPAKFVHAVFFEEEPRFPLNGATACVYGSIRAGRTDEQKSSIADAIRQSIEAHAGISRDDAMAVIVDTPASWVMEGGEIMPEPGEEAAWLAAQEAKHGAGSATT